MDSTFKFLGFGASLVIGSLLAGCSSGSDDPAGTGGSGNMGGSGNTGGTTAGGASGATKLFTFAMDEEGFMLNKGASAPPYTNLAALTTDPIPAASWVSTKDAGEDPNSGSLKVSANYTFWNQSVSVEAAPPQDTNGLPIDFTGKTVTARIFVESKGLSPYGFGDLMDAPGGVVFYMKSGSTYDWGQAGWVNVTTYGSWFSVKFNADNLDSGSKTTFDPGNVVQMGFQFSSGGGGAHCPDSATGDPNNAAFKGEPTATCPKWDAALPTVIYVDNITVTPN